MNDEQTSELGRPSIGKGGLLLWQERTCPGHLGINQRLRLGIYGMAQSGRHNHDSLSWRHTLRSGNICRSNSGDCKGNTNILVSHALSADALSLESDLSA